MNIKVCSLKYAPKELMTGQYHALISIGHPDGIEHVEGPAPRDRLDLRIGDVTPFRYGRVRYPLMTGEQCLQLIDFAKTLREEQLLLIHCKQGRSRSTAAALIVQAARGVSETKALETLLAGCPKAHPNGWMLRLCDAILGTKLFGYCRRAGIVKWEAKGQPVQEETAEQV